MINVNTNIAALKVMTAFNDSQGNLSKALQRLSTGLRVNSAKDDPSGMGVSMRLNAQIAQKNVVYNEVNNAVSFLATQDGVMDAADDVLLRMVSLATSARGAGGDTAALALYQVEYDALEQELYGYTNELFNGQNMFSNPGGLLVVNTSEITSQTASITLADLEGSVYNVVNGQNVSSATSAIEIARDNLAEMRARNGSEQNRFERAANVLDAGIINLTAANSRIMDADVAQESVNMTKYDILQQSSLAMLVQANQNKENILRLLE